MCGRRRHGNSHYRGPMVVVLGKMAYDKYHERQAQKVAAKNQHFQLPGPDVRSSLSNEEKLEKVGIDPPSYDDVVVNRAIVPEPQVKANDEKNAFDRTTARNVTDDIATSFDEERVHGVANGMNYSHVPVHAQMPRTGGCHSRCQQKKAMKAARKADERAARAAMGKLQM